MWLVGGTAGNRAKAASRALSAISSAASFAFRRGRRVLLPGLLVELSLLDAVASGSDFPEPPGGHEGFEEEYLRWCSAAALPDAA